MVTTSILSEPEQVWLHVHGSTPFCTPDVDVASTARAISTPWLYYYLVVVCDHVVVILYSYSSYFYTTW